MDFVTKLSKLMNERDLNKHTLARESGIPYTTIVGLLERGVENARLSTINSLCNYFDVPLDYLVLDKYDNPGDFVPRMSETSVICDDPGEIRLVQFYRSLNRTGKTAAISAIEGLANTPSFLEEKRSTETA